MSDRDAPRTAEPTNGLSVEELRRRCLVERQPLSEVEMRALRTDPRRGVRDLCRRLDRLRDRERSERRRLDALLAHETRLWRAGAERVAGIDEAGVGPLAGPLVAAAVMFHPDRPMPSGIDDSKRLSAAAREELAKMIRGVAAVGVGVASVEEIERLNVYHAGLLAMGRAVAALDPRPTHLLVDGRTLPGWSEGQTRIVGGDRLCYSIAAASIVAKTHRDGLMEELDRCFPEYGFAEHKGYPTPSHQAALARFGPCRLHRRGFPAVSEFAGAFSTRFYALREELRRAASSEEIRELRRRLRAPATGLAGPERKRLLALAGVRAATMGARATGPFGNGGPGKDCVAEDNFREPAERGLSSSSPRR